VTNYFVPWNYFVPHCFVNKTIAVAANVKDTPLKMAEADPLICTFYVFHLFLTEMKMKNIVDIFIVARKRQLTN